MKEPLAITLQAAADLLSLKDRRTIKRYVEQGRIQIVGTGNGQRVVYASIVAYLEGRSPWHAHQKPSPVAYLPLAPPVTGRAGRARGRRTLPSDSTGIGTIPLLQGRTLRSARKQGG